MVLKEKNKKHKKRFSIRGSDLIILFSLVGLLAFGSVMILSTAQGAQVGETSTYLMTGLKQLFFVALSCLLMLMMMWLYNYEWYSDIWPVIFIVFFVLMLSTFFFGTEIYGSRAWLVIGGVSLQPSEFAKPIIIMAMAYSVWKCRKKPEMRRSYWRLFRTPLLFTVATAILMFFQKDNGTMLITLGIAYFCTMVPSYPNLAKTQKRLTALVIVAAVGAIGIMSFSSTAADILAKFPPVAHVGVRIENMKDPYRDIYNEGYQPANSLYGIADAGISGKGLGNSARKYGYLTQAESDYILAVTIEETGLIGLGWITICYALLLWRLIYYAMKARIMADKVLLCGTAVYLLLHFIINIGGVGALIPMTGVPLLFISSGGSALMAVSIALGCCQARIMSMNKTYLKKDFRLSLMSSSDKSENAEGMDVLETSEKKVLKKSENKSEKPEDTVTRRFLNDEEKLPKRKDRHAGSNRHQNQKDSASKADDSALENKGSSDDGLSVTRTLKITDTAHFQSLNEGGIRLEIVETSVEDSSGLEVPFNLDRKLQSQKRSIEMEQTNKKDRKDKNKL